MAPLLEVDIKIANSIRELKECDIISCATPSKEPLITKELLHLGLHINSVGMGAGLGKKEVDFGILREMKVVVDDREVAQMDVLSEAFRDGFITNSEIYGSLGDLILGGVPGRTAE